MERGNMKGNTITINVDELMPHLPPVVPGHLVPVGAFFVYYNWGGCNYGDHSSGMKPCTSAEEARVFAEECKAQDRDADVVIVQGRVVSKHPETWKGG